MSTRLRKSEAWESRGRSRKQSRDEGMSTKRYQKGTDTATGKKFFSTQLRKSIDKNTIISGQAN